MTQTVYLHVGTHKTGTTSFQTCLYNNRDALAQNGARLYVEAEGDPASANCVKLAHSVLRRSLQTPSRRAAYVKKQGLFQRAVQDARIKRFLASQDSAKAIVSAEAFCFARTSDERNDIRRLFARGGLSIVPVICFRSDRGWRKSWFSHLDRWEAQFEGPAGDGTDNIRNEWYFDRDAVLAFWSGLGAPQVVDYDAAVAEHGTVIPDLFKAMDIPCDVELSPYFLNKSK